MLVNYLLQRDVNSFESLNAYVDMKITLKYYLNIAIVAIVGKVN